MYRKPPWEKIGKKRCHFPIWTTPSPKRVKRGHLLSEQNCVYIKISLLAFQASSDSVKFLSLVAEIGNPTKKCHTMNFLWKYADKYESWCSNIIISSVHSPFPRVLGTWQMSNVQPPGEEEAWCQMEHRKDIEPPVKKFTIEMLGKSFPKTAYQGSRVPNVFSSSLTSFHRASTASPKLLGKPMKLLEKLLKGKASWLQLKV